MSSFDGSHIINFQCVNLLVYSTFKDLSFTFTLLSLELLLYFKVQCDLTDLHFYGTVPFCGQYDVFLNIIKFYLLFATYINNV